MKSLLLLAIAGTLPLSANASNWIHIGYSDTFLEYVDTDSISTEGNYRTAIYKDIFFEDQVLTNYEPFNLSFIFAKYDCSNNPKKIKSLSYLDMKDDEVVDSGNVESFSEWNIVYPDTIGESTADFICTY